MNKSQGRPRRTQREQTLSFGATIHDFSKWSGLVVLQPEPKNITGNPFSKIIRAIKKRFLCCLLTMIKNGWVKKKWRKTLTIYPARKNSEKRYKKESVTPSVLNKKKLLGTFAKIWIWQSGQTFKKFKHIGSVKNVGNVPNVSDVFNVHFIYIYIVISQINSFSF